jgi:hypothetical protein
VRDPVVRVPGDHLVEAPLRLRPVDLPARAEATRKVRAVVSSGSVTGVNRSRAVAQSRRPSAS